jgi:hypothetical protein
LPFRTGTGTPYTAGVAEGRRPRCADEDAGVAVPGSSADVGRVFFDMPWAGLVAADFDAGAKVEVEKQAKNVIDGHCLDSCFW